MDKKKLLYWILLVFVLFINFFIYKFILNQIIPWTLLTEILSVFIFVLAVIPLSVFIAEMLTDYFLS